jgi:methionyl-tRNA formyltransferase
MWRAYTPWPGITCMTESDKKYKNLQMSPPPMVTTCETLSFKKIGRGLLLANEHGAIQIDLIQEEGRTAITGQEFIQGFPESISQIPLKKMS